MSKPKKNASTSGVANETWVVNPQYGKGNVYWVWDADSNYHDDISPEAMDVRTKLIAAAPKMALLLIRGLTHVTHGGPTREEVEGVLREAGVI